MINQDTIKALREAIEKCGGPGGTPGPCPGPRKPKKPSARTSPKPSTPPKAPRTLEAAVMPHFDAIQKSRKKVFELAKKLGFVPTSSDKQVAIQQAVEWAQVHVAKRTRSGKTSKYDINPRILDEAISTAAVPKAKPKLPVTEPAKKPKKKKPPVDKNPPKKPAGKRPVTDPKTGKTSVSRKPKTVEDPVNEANSIIELTKSPETRKVAVDNPSIARLAGRSFAQVTKALTGMKPADVWPNRKQAARNLVAKFKKEFTDENATKLIDTAVSHVKKVFTKEAAAARIVSHFLGEKAW